MTRHGGAGGGIASGKGMKRGEVKKVTLDWPEVEHNKVVGREREEM